MLLRSCRGASNSLKSEYAPDAMKGCAYSSSVEFGVKVTASRVSIDSVFCTSEEKTYRLRANPVAVGSSVVVTYCWIPRVRLYDGPNVTDTFDTGFQRSEVFTADWKPPSRLRWKRGLMFRTIGFRESVLMLAERTSPAGSTAIGPPRINRSSYA